jgi:hypothetical protein
MIVINYQFIYYINVKTPKLDLKVGTGSKAGNFFSGKREGGESKIGSYLDRGIERKRLGWLSLGYVMFIRVY